MPRSLCIVFLFATLVLGSTPSVSADIIVNSVVGWVSASIDPGPPATDTTSMLTGSVTQTFLGTANNFTTSSESHSWNFGSLTLTGNGLITETKTVSAGAGRTHRGESSLTFVFNNTAAANFSLGGTYGFLNDSVTLPDSVGWSLVGPSTNFSQSALAGGGDSQPFFGSGQLGAGTYTFTITARLDERINNASARSANWSLTFFNLEPLTAIPEAGSVFCGALVIGLGLLWYAWRRAGKYRPAPAYVEKLQRPQPASARTRPRTFTRRARRNASCKFDRDELAA